MLVSDEIRGRLIAFTVLAMMLVPAFAAAAPTVSDPSQTPTYSEQIGDWWENTRIKIATIPLVIMASLSAVNMTFSFLKSACSQTLL